MFQHFLALFPRFKPGFLQPHACSSCPNPSLQLSHAPFLIPPTLPSTFSLPPPYLLHFIPPSLLHFIPPSLLHFIHPSLLHFIPPSLLHLTSYSSLPYTSLPLLLIHPFIIHISPSHLHTSTSYPSLSPSYIYTLLHLTSYPSLHHRSSLSSSYIHPPSYTLLHLTSYPSLHHRYLPLPSLHLTSTSYSSLHHISFPLPPFYTLPTSYIYILFLPPSLIHPSYSYSALPLASYPPPPPPTSSHTLSPPSLFPLPWRCHRLTIPSTFFLPRNSRRLLPLHPNTPPPKPPNLTKDTRKNKAHQLMMRMPTERSAWRFLTQTILAGLTGGWWQRR